MTRVFWILAYARIALRSRYQFTVLSALSEAIRSWEDTAERGSMSPAEAFREDAFEWSLM